MKRSLKRLIGQGIFGVHASLWLLRGEAVVVAFHRVQARASDDPLSVDASTFEHYCTFFKRWFRVMPLPELVATLGRGGPMDRALAITFDDGYEDNFQIAAPILESLALPATFFVVTQWIGTSEIAWWDRNESTRHPWMTWDQVRSLHARGFEIGAHTRTHVDLGRVSEEEAREEIAGARVDLERELNAPVRSFAYPYGRRDNITEATRRIVRDSGFQCCCAAFGGTNTVGTDPFRLLRVPVTSECASPHEFGFEVALGRTVSSV